MKNNLRQAILIIALLFTSRIYPQEVDIDNVVIVLDASGSMAEPMMDARGNRVSKINAARAALYEVLKQVPDTTHIGLLVFSSTKGEGIWFYELGPKDDAKLQQAISSIQPSGGTPLGTYMKAGADRLLKEREKQFNYGSYRLLVVTDGEANSERANLVDIYTKDIISRGITLDVIGVAMAERHTLATKVHSYRGANDPASFTRAIREVFAEVTSDKTDAAGEDAFALIAGIPAEVAEGMITAFSQTGNHPIGAMQSQPEPRQSPQVQRINPPGVVRNQVPIQRPNRVSGDSFFKIVFGVFFVVIILSGIIKMSKH
ncbi:MAG: VWA domain-containing protein [Sedimentisphaerales bacterium]|nr:VWA domain-containing protein [Sedimentisphaerales bacterium]